MRKIRITPTNGRTTLYVKGSPDLRILSRQDYDTFVGAMELSIREYYKPETDGTPTDTDLPP